MKNPLSNVFKKYANKVGLPPGTLVYTGEDKTEPILINQIDYNETQCQESKIEKYTECQSIHNPDTITWIHIQGIHDAESVREIGAHFSIHTLVLEDIMNPTQLPKIEEFDEYTFGIIRTLNYDTETNSISDEPIDLSDHILQLIHTLETLRMSASTLFGTYSTALNHKMNEVMKVLTLVATFFIPLTFIAGIYGMNFQNMPELNMPWGYPIVLLVMLGICITMFIYFKKKKWF